MKGNERRGQLKKYVSVVEELIKKSSDNKIVLREIQELKNNIDDDLFTVLVLGEFKRGKSTFINSLLGEELMVTDVLPETATIQAIMYNDEKIAEAIYKDGTKEKGKANMEFLKKFSAKNDDTSREIQYVKVGYPCELLKNRVVLVDTPGVADMDEQRVQVTYDFLPKANAVIFLLDATSPLKRTEKEFIKDYLLPRGIENIIFVVNKMDLLDEDEIDLDDHLNNIKLRIANAFGDKGKLKEPVLLTVSAYLAMQGIKTGNQRLIEKSNIKNVIDQLNQMLFKGDMEMMKLNVHRDSFLCIIDKWKTDQSRQKEMLLADGSQLEKELANMRTLADSMKEKYSLVKSFVVQENDFLLTLLDKSIDKFKYDLLEEIDYQIERYQGTEFKLFMEKDIPHIIKKQTDLWLKGKSRSIDIFYNKMDEKLSYGLSMYFNKRVFLDSTSSEEIKVRPNMHMEVTDVSQSVIKAGAVTAVGVIAMSALGFGIVAPLISMAILPSLRDSFLKEELKTSKEQVVPLVHREIDVFMDNLHKEIQNNIYKRTDAVVDSAKLNFECYVTEYICSVEKCLEEKRQQEEDVTKRISILDNNTLLIDKLVEGLKNV